MPASPLSMWSAVSWPLCLCALADAPGGIIAICKLITRAPTDCLEIPGAHRYPCFPTNSGPALTIWQDDVTSPIMSGTRLPSTSTAQSICAGSTGERLLHNRAMCLSIASSSFGSTPSAFIIALTPESDMISAIVGSRFQFEQPAWIGACTALIRLADETAAFRKLNFGFSTESCFDPYSVRAISRKLLRSSQHFSKKIVANLNLGLERFASAGRVRVRAHGAESSGHSNKICQRCCLHFSHQIGAMNFHGCFAGLNLAGDLLVAPARHDQSHYRPLPRSQRIAAPAQLGKQLFICSGRAVSLDDNLHRIQEVLLTEGLG